MSNETDLDWLTRNVHVWPYDRQSHCYVMTEIGAKKAISACAYSPFFSKFTRYQWLASRAVWQNKPSFADHPDAKCFAQSKGGCWFKNIVTDDVMPKDDKWVLTVGSIVNGWRWVQDGYVLGDWRDTLEKRPEELHVCKAEVVGSNQATECNVTYEVSGDKVIVHSIDMSERAVTARLQEATANVISAVPELKSDKYKFDPFIRIEHNQEQEMSQQQDVKQDNGWFERGELPPVGIQCEAIITSERVWVEIEVVCHRDGFALGWCQKEKCGYHGDKPKDFRPIRTERDVLMSVLECYSGALPKEYQRSEVDDAILAAGFGLVGGAQ